MSETELSEPGLLSFKEIDILYNRPKGTAFRAFKRLGEQLAEGVHFFYLDAWTQSAEIELLRQRGRIYASTVHVVLLTEAGLALLRPLLDQQP